MNVKSKDLEAILKKLDFRINDARERESKAWEQKDLTAYIEAGARLDAYTDVYVMIVDAIREGSK